MPISPPPVGPLEICLAPPPGPSTTLLPGVPSQTHFGLFHRRVSKSSSFAPPIPSAILLFLMPCSPSRSLCTLHTLSPLVCGIAGTTLPHLPKSKFLPYKY